MTIIAYRDGIMVADTAISDSNLIYAHATKIFKAKDGALVGAAGDNSACELFIYWAIGDRVSDPPKEAFRKGCLDGVVVTPKGEILYYDGIRPTRLSSDHICIGAGYQVGLGAMYAGGSARKAVQAAISLVMSCGGEIQTLTLKGGK